MGADLLQGMDEVTWRRVKRTKNHPLKKIPSKGHTKEDPVKCPEETFK